MSIVAEIRNRIADKIRVHSEPPPSIMLRPATQSTPPSPPEKRYAPSPFKLPVLQERMLNPEVLIEITSRCNFACDYCTSPFKDRPKADMTMELFQHIVKQLPGITARDIRLHVDGEPTMHAQFREMVQLVNERGMRVALATNGSRLDPSMLELNIWMTITVSTTPEEFKTRHKKMDFDKYVETVTNYVREWGRRDNKQVLMLQFIHGRPDQPDADLKRQMAMVERFIEQAELKQNSVWKPEDPTLFWKSATSSVRTLKYDIVGGGLYPINGQLVVPKVTDVGFCNSPWQRLTILCDGRVGFCCVDLSGKATHTEPGEIWEKPLVELWRDHQKVQHIRQEFTQGRVSEDICRKCLGGWQVPVIEHSIY